MVEHSGNGWPVLERAQLTWFHQAGESFAAANIHVAYVASYLIRRYNAEVEPLAGPVLDDWSYAVRKVRDSTRTISNHSSATAWDLNAIKHPRGVRGTFSPVQVTAVRKILASIVDNSGRRIFRWGNDYVDSPIDSMHFEINADPARVAEAHANLLEDEPMTPTEIQDLAKAVAKETADEMFRRFQSLAVIPNLPVADGEPAGKPWTVFGWAAAQDRKADIANRKIDLLTNDKPKT